MSRHILVVELDTAYAEQFPDAPFETKWSIECPDGNGCAGWTECLENHEGYDPEDEASPAYDEYEDVEIHGVVHEWRWGNNWTVPFKGCVVRDQDTDPPDALWRTREDGDQYLPVGRWVIEDDWDDVWCSLTLVGPEEETSGQ